MYAKQEYVDGKRKLTREGQLWYDIRKRTNPNSSHNKTRPTYVGCLMSDEFKNFDWFAEWCNSQIGFRSRDEKGHVYHLDKDLLLNGNRVYGPQHCIFLPPDVNVFLTKRQNDRGECPIGVSWHKRDKIYTAQCNNGKGDLVHFGYFECPHEAHKAYKRFKENLAKELAEKWKEQIDSRAYEALRNYTVEATD